MASIEAVRIHRDPRHHKVQRDTRDIPDYNRLSLCLGHSLSTSTLCFVPLRMRNFVDKNHGRDRLIANHFDLDGRLAEKLVLMRDVLTPWGISCVQGRTIFLGECNLSRYKGREKG